MSAMGHSLWRWGAGAAVALTLALAAPVHAVQPDEILPDPALEERARDISAGLRCVVCRNESIDDSNAELARDLRLLVREQAAIFLPGDGGCAMHAHLPLTRPPRCHVCLFPFLLNRTKTKKIETPHPPTHPPTQPKPALLF